MNVRLLPITRDSSGRTWALWPWVATDHRGIGRGYTRAEAVAELETDPQ